MSDSIVRYAMDRFFGLIERFFNGVSSMFEDENGGESTMRIVVFLCVLIVFSVWAYLCIVNRTLYSFELKDLGVIGTLLGSKIFQKQIEVREAITVNGKGADDQ